MIVNNQTRMIDSLLNRYKDRIVVDRIIHHDTNTGQDELLIQLGDVLNKVDEQFVDLQHK